MKYRISKHASNEMMRRGISFEIVEEILENPGQVVMEYNEKKAYQVILEFESGKRYLVRVIVDDSVDPLVVVTVYRTSKISKYWREP